MSESISALTQNINMERKYPKIAIIVAIAILAIIAILGYGIILSNDKQTLHGQNIEFSLQSFDKEVLNTSTIDKPVIVNFWASWCVECDKEMAILQESYTAYGSKVQFIGVDYVDTEAKALAYLEKYGITYPNGPDLGGDLSNLFNVEFVPYTFFINTDGTIIGSHIGPLTREDLQIWVNKLLESQT